MIKIKICTQCKENKELPEFNKSAESKDGHRPICRECDKKHKLEKRLKDPIDYCINEMAHSILYRIKYCQYDGYEHLNCYKINNVQCKLGENRIEVAKTLRNYFYEDIKALIDIGLTPSVDRIDSKGNYEIGNIRIIEAIKNSIEGFKNANKEKMKPVMAIYPNGIKIEFESINSAARQTSMASASIQCLLKSGGKSRKDKIQFQYIIK